MKYANCSFCDGSVKPEQIETEFWWGDQLVVFENVPAGVCEVCGEQYFQGEVYDRMVKLAQVERSEIPIIGTETDEAPRKVIVPAWDFAASSGVA